MCDFRSHRRTRILAFQSTNLAYNYLAKLGLWITIYYMPSCIRLIALQVKDASNQFICIEFVQLDVLQRARTVCLRYRGSSWMWLPNSHSGGLQWGIKFTRNKEQNDLKLWFYRGSSDPSFCTSGTKNARRLDGGLGDDFVDSENWVSAGCLEAQIG